MEKEWNEEGRGERARVEENKEYEREEGGGGKLELERVRSKALDSEIKWLREEAEGGRSAGHRVEGRE